MRISRSESDTDSIAPMGILSFCPLWVLYPSIHNGATGSARSARPNREYSPSFLNRTPGRATNSPSATRPGAVREEGRIRCRESGGRCRPRIGAHIRTLPGLRARSRVGSTVPRPLPRSIHARRYSARKSCANSRGKRFASRQSEPPPCPAAWTTNLSSPSSIRLYSGSRPDSSLHSRRMMGTPSPRRSIIRVRPRSDGAGQRANSETTSSFRFDCLRWRLSRVSVLVNAPERKVRGGCRTGAGARGRRESSSRDAPRRSRPLRTPRVR